MTQLYQLGVRVKVHQETSLDVSQFDLYEDNQQCPKISEDTPTHPSVYSYTFRPMSTPITVTHTVDTDRREHVLKDSRQQMRGFILATEVIEHQLHQWYTTRVCVYGGMGL